MSGSPYALAAVCGLMVSSLALDQLSAPRQEIFTECVCWLSILLGGKLYFNYIAPKPRQFSASGLSVIALGATLLCLSSSILKTVWVTAPLLCVILTFITKRSLLLPTHNESKVEDATAQDDSRRNVILLAVYAIVTMLGLWQGDLRQAFAVQVFWLLSQAVLYWGLFGRVHTPKDTDPSNFLESLQTAMELAHLMSAVTVPLMLVSWYWLAPNPVAGILGIFKAVRWVAIIVLAHDSKLSIAAWITVFAACMTGNGARPNELQALFILGGALFALYHIGLVFPRSTAGRYITIAFSLYPIWGFARRDHLKSSLAAWSGLSSSSKAFSSKHPIFNLAEQARAKHAQTQARQSQSLQEAVAQYKKRYGRSPPRGFDDWYQFAVDNNVELIDEYDLLTKSLEPFWQVTPSVLRNYVDQAIAIKDNGYNTLTVKNHQAVLSDGSFQHAQLVQLFEPIVKFLPDFKAALNERDEPRILIPYDKLHNTQRKGKEHVVGKPHKVYYGNQNKQITWESATISCPPDSLARSPEDSAQSTDSWPHFVSSLNSAQDICDWPAAFSQRHGFLSSPSTFSYTHSFVPTLATAKLSSFHDILIPSSYYFQSDIAEYKESKDPSWENKTDVVYWRGSGTGGHWHGGSWKMGHRQRFVEFTNDANAPVVLLNRTTTNRWAGYRTKMKQVLSKFKVEFSNFIQCDDEDCKAQEAHFHKAAWDVNSDSLGHKILYNLDGNSFSGRYYRFLKSNSLVFMQALFKEWHDDRIIPWVHFVPISVGMEELPEATRYFLDDPEGKVLAKRIADEGRDWSRKTLRPVDLSAAYLRAFLEYARLVDDNRSEMDYQ